jgi:hypothetical protein
VTSDHLTPCEALTCLLFGGFLGAVAMWIYSTPAWLMDLADWMIDAVDDAIRWVRSG